MLYLILFIFFLYLSFKLFQEQRFFNADAGLQDFFFWLELLLLGRAVGKRKSKPVGITLSFREIEAVIGTAKGKAHFESLCYFNGIIYMEVRPFK